MVGLPWKLQNVGLPSLCGDGHILGINKTEFIVSGMRSFLILRDPELGSTAGGSPSRQTFYEGYFIFSD